MKKKIMVFAALIGVLGSKAIASPNEAEQAQIEKQKEQKAIAELLDKGIIEWNQGHFTVKDQDALEQLRKLGRVDLLTAVEHVVCY